MKIQPFKMRVKIAEYKNSLIVLNKYGFGLPTITQSKDCFRYIYVNKRIQQGNSTMIFKASKEPELAYEQFLKLYDK